MFFGKSAIAEFLLCSGSNSRYVVRGRLLINVDGQDIRLREGDLIVVNPNTCHGFTTTAEEVVFLAIKKEPGLSDKKLCQSVREWKYPSVPQ